MNKHEILKELCKPCSHNIINEGQNVGSLVLDIFQKPLTFN